MKGGGNGNIPVWIGFVRQARVCSHPLLSKNDFFLPAPTGTGWFSRK